MDWVMCIGGLGGGNILRTLLNPGTLIGDKLGIPDPLLDMVAPQKSSTSTAQQKAGAAQKPVRPASLLSLQSLSTQ